MNITLTMAISSNPRTWPILDGTRLNVKGKGEYVKNTAIGRIMRDCLITCTFLAVGPPEKQVIGNKMVAEGVIIYSLRYHHRMYMAMPLGDLLSSDDGSLTCFVTTYGLSPKNS